MSVAQSPGFVLRGWHVLAAMLLFFGAVIAVNVGFAVVAVRSFPGEDVRRSYLQGLHYNDALAERRAQAALGWRASAALSSAGDVAEVIVDVRDRTGRPLRDAAVTGELRWPADARLDRSLSFSRQPDGRYIAPVGDLPNGRWRLRARATGEQNTALDFEAELTWPVSQR